MAARGGGKSTRFWAKKKNSHFPPKIARKSGRNAQTKGNGSTLHVQLEFTMSKSPLVPSNSTICPTTAQKGAKKPQNLHNVNQHPKPSTGRILGYVAQIRIRRAPSPLATPPFLWFSSLRIPPLSHVEPRTTGHWAELEGSPAGVRRGRMVGPARFPGRKKLFFPKLFLDHLGCSNKWF